MDRHKYEYTVARAAEKISTLLNDLELIYSLNQVEFPIRQHQGLLLRLLAPFEQLPALARMELMKAAVPCSLHPEVVEVYGSPSKSQLLQGRSQKEQGSNDQAHEKGSQDKPSASQFNFVDDQIAQEFSRWKDMKIFTPEQELEIVEEMRTLFKARVKLQDQKLRDVAQRIIRKYGINDCFSRTKQKNWARFFRRRHPEVSSMYKMSHFNKNTVPWYDCRNLTFRRSPRLQKP